MLPPITSVADAPLFLVSPWPAVSGTELGDDAPDLAHVEPTFHLLPDKIDGDLYPVVCLVDARHHAGLPLKRSLSRLHTSSACHAA
ncbi:MAG: hypothetical protein M3380_00860 [Chloroflexota bacterium]|nr:hypothetical protein [Chloroflexota bacterium]